MLDLKDITLHYGHSQILNGISMQADVGEVTCVMHRNFLFELQHVRNDEGYSFHPKY